MTKITTMSIKTFIGPMKKANKQRIETDSIIIDLDNLYMTYDETNISLSKLSCNYGGYRYYFICPECGKLCYKLFTITGNEDWKCNDCIGLKARTLNRTKTDCTTIGA